MGIRAKIQAKRLEIEQKRAENGTYRVKTWREKYGFCRIMYIATLGGLIGASYMFISLNVGQLFETKTIYINLSEAKEVKTESVEDIIRRVAFEKSFNDVDLLLRIAKCESSFNRYAKNDKSSARGIFQILDLHNLSVDDRNNPEFATAWTIDKIRKDGIGAWNSSKSCWN